MAMSENVYRSSPLRHLPLRRKQEFSLLSERAVWYKQTHSLRERMNRCWQTKAPPWRLHGETDVEDLRDSEVRSTGS